MWIDGVAVAVIENDTVYYVRTDKIGRPVFATDDTGTKVWEASYLPFGGVQTTTGSPIELRFPGQWFQSESGLHQNWMRDYDPTTGRYMQADPLGLVDGASIYGYALQNPGRYTDRRGEAAVAVCLIPGLCAGAAALCVDGFLIVTAIVAGTVIITSVDTCDDCSVADDDCPYEQSLSNLRPATKRQLKLIIDIIGHPHDLKDGSFEDMYVSKNGCVYVGNKNGTGVGRWVGRI